MHVRFASCLGVRCRCGVRVSGIHRPSLLVGHPVLSIKQFNPFMRSSLKTTLAFLLMNLFTVARLRLLQVRVIAEGIRWECIYTTQSSSPSNSASSPVGRSPPTVDIAMPTREPLLDVPRFVLIVKINIYRDIRRTWLMWGVDVTHRLSLVPENHGAGTFPAPLWGTVLAYSGCRLS